MNMHPPNGSLQGSLAIILLLSQSVTHAMDTPLIWSRQNPNNTHVETPSQPFPAVISSLPTAPTAPTAPAVPRTIMPLDPMIDSIAHDLQLDPRLLHAMIHVESRYNSDATSSKGALGLMQVLPATGERFGYTNLMHHPTNVRAGASYVKWLLNHFDQDLELALAGYNAGEGAVKKYARSIPPYPETQNYVRQVMAQYREATIATSTGAPRQPIMKAITAPGETSAASAIITLNRIAELLLSSPPTPLKANASD